MTGPGCEFLSKHRYSLFERDSQIGLRQRWQSGFELNSRSKRRERRKWSSTRSMYGEPRAERWFGFLRPPVLGWNTFLCTMMKSRKQDISWIWSQHGRKEPSSRSCSSQPRLRWGEYGKQHGTWVADVFMVKNVPISASGNGNEGLHFLLVCKEGCGRMTCNYLECWMPRQDYVRYGDLGSWTPHINDNAFETLSASLMRFQQNDNIELRNSN